MSTIDISEMDSADVLAALYNAAKPQGLGILHIDPTPMTTEDARKILSELPEGHFYFDYLKGRVMKVDLRGPELQTRLYDRDNGQGAAEAALRAANLL